jgi:hypothetical protein
MMLRATAFALLCSTSFAFASGCDGFHRCRCGVTAARHAGLPLDYHGMNLKQARTWYRFPRTTCHAGAVGIPHAHHVFTVVECDGNSVRVVDDAGNYVRPIGRTIFVDPPHSAFVALDRIAPQ